MNDLVPALVASLRVALATILVCVAGYTGAILAFAQLVTPDTANGSLIRADNGAIVGSRQVAQPFVRPEYFWPRPSAVDYDAAGAGGSNLSPTSIELTERAAGLIERYGATPQNPLPPELVAASGGGLDPHISEPAASYQAARIAAARGLPAARVQQLIRDHAFAAGGILAPGRIVNVLELNLALDQLPRP